MGKVVDYPIQSIPLRHMVEGDFVVVADSDTPDFVVDHHLSLAIKPGDS